MSWGPLFAGIYKGSLRGKPDHLLVWCWIIANKDRHGIVDANFNAIADETGLSSTAVAQVIHSFCQPDPDSRCQLNEGRRLQPLPERGFGWRVVTNELYGARVRKQLYDARRTETGVDAERKRVARVAAQKSKRPDASRRVPTVPDSTSDYITSHEETESETAPKARRPAKRMPAEYVIPETLREWALQHAPDVNIDAELAAIKDCEFKTAHKDWDAAFRNWLRREQKNARPRATRVQPERETKFQRMRRRANEAAE